MTIKKNDRDLAYRYAWDWFEYHAKQRLTTFNFFLIIIGALGYMYSQAFQTNHYSLCALIAILGSAASFCFLCLEIRNTILVNHGRIALDILDNTKGVEPFKTLGIRIMDKKRKGLLNFFVSHTFWLRLTMSISFAVFLYLTFYSFNKGRDLFKVVCDNYYIIIIAVVIIGSSFLISIYWEDKPKT